MPKVISDATYDEELERMSHLTGFPHVPKARLEARKALRRITSVDSQFLHRVVSEVIDAGDAFPALKELKTHADTARRHRKSAGKADCKLCEGSGFVNTIRRVTPLGMPPYEAEFAAPCSCRGE